MAQWLDVELATLKTLAGSLEDRVRHFAAAMENEIHHGAGLGNLAAVTREFVERAGEVSAALLAGVKPAEVKAASAAATEV